MYKVQNGFAVEMYKLQNGFAVEMYEVQNGLAVEMNKAQWYKYYKISRTYTLECFT